MATAEPKDQSQGQSTTPDTPASAQPPTATGAPSDREALAPTVEFVQFQVVERSGLVFCLGNDGSLWVAKLADGIVQPPPVWQKFWPIP